MEEYFFLKLQKTWQSSHWYTYATHPSEKLIKMVKLTGHVLEMCLSLSPEIEVWGGRRS
jgi:hypothetical protein